MYFTGKLRLFAAVAFAAIASVALLSQPALPQQASRPQDRCPLNPLDSPLPLGVVGIPKDACRNYTTKDFGDMAWQTFKTLVWPAVMTNPSKRGEPDTLLPITRKGPLVFETYKADWETFNKDGVTPPLVWDKYPETADVCAGAPPINHGSLVLGSIHKFGNLDAAFGRLEAPSFHILVSQKGSLVRYLTSFGKQTFNTILDNGLYGPLAVGRSEEEPVWPRLFDPGSVTIKSAWIEMDGYSEAEKLNFHTRKALVQKPDSDPAKRTCSETLVGLVALHVAHKTESSRQWIWASFEHIRNVPNSGQSDGNAYTFHDGKSTMLSAPPPKATFPLDDPFTIPTPFNVERQQVIAQVIRDLNDTWRDILKDTVWSNYRLVTVQWPRYKDRAKMTGADRDEPGKPTATPLPPCFDWVGANVSVANPVMETFLQLDSHCGMNKTCMSCHNRARNYDFIWSIPKKDHEHDKAAISVLREIMWGKR
ncbi:hypothetical protein [Reyranella sp.]|uniref:hypothetical protein n=1 Tax=Reyranella sp. TaxID=1929291 RepID=UPI00272FF302|nr:hypothetical protein [Reyranella sp.]MDP2377192.1 hypothetical protein [Reyranella sp.]